MLYELDILEIRQIAELALDVRKVRDRLLERVRDADLGVLSPLRGEHDPVANADLAYILAPEPEFVALSQAITALPRDIREKLFLVARMGRGDLAIRGWDSAADAASRLGDQDILTILMDDANLHDHLQKGLYVLGGTQQL